MPTVLCSKKRSLPSSLVSSKSKKAKLTKKQKTEKAMLMNDAIESVCSQDMSHISAAEVSLSSVSTQINELLKLVEHQQLVIKSLDTKVSIMMSFLGLSSKPVTQSSLQDHDIDVDGVLTQNLPAATDSMQQATTDFHPEQSEPPQTRTSTTTANYRAASLKGAIRQTVLSTVYVNQCIKEKRANNVVIKGLQTVDDSSSLQESVTRLLSTELHMQANIKHCKRLGRPAIGRTQPLLVVLSSVDEANSILSAAKELRQSSDPFVAQCVYIGPNLTASEAQAEFELRCRRRQRVAQQRSSPIVTVQVPAASARPANTAAPMRPAAAVFDYNHSSRTSESQLQLMMSSVESHSRPAAPIFGCSSDYSNDLAPPVDADHFLHFQPEAMHTSCHDNTSHHTATDPSLVSGQTAAVVPGASI